MSDEKNIPEEKDSKIPESEDTIEIASPGEALTGQFAQDSSITRNLEQNPQLAPPASSADKTPQAPSPLDGQANPADSQGSKLGTPVKRLSSEQVQSIASRFSADHEVASETEREQLLKSLGNDSSESSKKVVAHTPAPPIAKASGILNASNSPSTQKAAPNIRAAKKPNSTLTSPARGIALFSGRVITLSASEKMSAGDDLVVSGNHYQLKPGKSKFNLFSLAVSFVLIVASAFVGKYFLAGNSKSGGEIIGIAMGQNGQPYAEGAIIRLPELGISTVTNTEGLFRFSELPDGKHNLEYNLAGSLGGSQSVMISGGEAVMVSLDDATEKLAQATPLVSKRISSPRVSSRDTKPSAKSAPRSKSAQTSSSVKGSLAVTSDIAGATVFIDDQKLGTVNRTFRRMNSGDRIIRIEKPGYEPYEANVTIQANKIAKVNVTLVPLQVQQKVVAAKELSSSELYQNARQSFKLGNYEETLRDLNEALEKDPSFAEAYFLRGESLAKNGDPKAATLDYIRAGEIWSRQRRSQDALSAFDNAVEVSNGSALAFKVRGDFFVNSKKRARGIEDYRQAVHVDKNYYDAHLALGVSLFESGSYRKADKELRRAKDFNDKDPVLYQYLMLNSLAKNDLSDVNNYFKQFKKKATPAEMARFRANDKLIAIRRIVKD